MSFSDIAVTTALCSCFTAFFFKKNLGVVVKVFQAHGLERPAVVERDEHRKRVHGFGHPGAEVARQVRARGGDFERGGVVSRPGVVQVHAAQHGGELQQRARARRKARAEVARARGGRFAVPAKTPLKPWTRPRWRGDVRTS
jgi:hypothetical protein